MWPDAETILVMLLLVIVLGAAVWYELTHPYHDPDEWQVQKRVTTPVSIPIGTATRVMFPGEQVWLNGYLFEMEEHASVGTALEINPETGMVRRYQGRVRTDSA